MTSDRELDDLKAALLQGLRVDPPPDQGYEAFERHQLLAIRFHRAARLNAPRQGERAGWRLYFKEHFPRGDEHALLLWEEWRIALLKDEYPGSGVAISHGQPQAHWQMVDPGGLFINLESMWDDFEQSVDAFMKMLGRETDRRAEAIEWWSNRQWSVQLVAFSPASSASASLAASVSASATSIVQKLS